jgi:hypothetical protein
MTNPALELRNLYKSCDKGKIEARQGGKIEA